MMRCLAIDDEPLALAQIAGYVERTSFLQLAGTCPSALQAMDYLRENPVDFLLVDINMPDLNGMDFVKLLPEKPMVVFTTAYSEYAVEGFRVNAVDYMLKPIGYHDFLQSMEKAYRQFKLHGNTSFSSATDWIFVKSDYKQVRVEIRSIDFIESRSEYVRIYTDSGKPLMTLGSMKNFEGNLPSHLFMRVHRSYIVNLEKITAVERNQILISKEHRITIGDQYKDTFKDYLTRHSFFK